MFSMDCKQLSAVKADTIPKAHAAPISDFVAWHYPSAMVY